MKKHILATATLLLAANTSVFAQQTPAADPAPDQPEFKSYIDFGPSVYLMKMSGEFADDLDIKSKTAYGAVFGTGVRCFNSDLGSARFGMELGIYGYSHATSVWYYSYSYGWRSAKADLSVVIVPVLIKAGYDFKLGESFSVNLGVGVGVTTVNGNLRAKSIGLKDDSRASAATFAFDLGATYHLSEAWELGFSYKFLTNGDMKLAEGYDKVGSSGHAFAITAGCKF